jgi:hypothetical protein
MRILFQNKHKRSLDLGRQEVRVEVGKDLPMEFYVDQNGVSNHSMEEGRVE